MDQSQIKKYLPESELGEIRPCTAPGKVQFHLLVAGKKDPSNKVINVLKLEKLLMESTNFSKVKSSAELGVVKALYNNAELSILASGRVVVRKADDEKQAQVLLETLAPLLKTALF